MKLLQEKVKSLKSWIFQKKEFQWYLDDSINHIRYLKKTNINHENSIHIQGVLDKIRFLKIMNILLLVLAWILSIYLSICSFKLVGIVIENTDYQNYSRVEYLALFKTIILSVFFLALSLVLLIVPIRLLNFSNYHELENRYKSLLMNNNKENLTIEEIVTFLLKKVSDKQILIKAEDFQFIIDEKTVSKMINLLNDIPDLFSEQYNRIAAYFYQLKVIKAPENATELKMLEIWMKINGNREAKGSPGLILNPLLTKSEATGTILKRLNEVKTLFEKIGFTDGVSRVVEDISKVSKNEKAKKRNISPVNTNNKINA